MNAGYEIHDLKNFRSRGKNSARSGVFNAVNIFFRDCDAFHLKQGEDTVQSFLISSDTTVSVYMNIHIWVMLFQRTNLLDHFVDEKYSLFAYAAPGCQMTWEKYLYPCEFPYQTMK